MLTPKPGVPFVIPGDNPALPTLTRKRPRDPTVVPSDGHDEADETGKETPIDDLIEAFNEVMRTARRGQHPAAWLRAAQSAEGADYLSLFDGDKGNINKSADLFNLVGLPPVDNRNSLYPVNL